jgi:hypothetical protein
VGEHLKQKSLLKADLGEAALSKLPPAAQQRLRVAWFYFVIATIVAIHVWVAVEYDGEGTSGTILLMFQVVVFVTSIWVALDAKAQRILPPAKSSDREQSSRTFDAKLDPLRWFGGCLALWVVMFPWYLSLRSKSKAATPPAVKVDAAAELRRYKQLRDDGVISEAEWDLKRRELLGTN